MRFLGLTLGNWRSHSTRSSGLLAALSAGTPSGPYLFSARTCGLKGIVPGSRHSWISVFDGGQWHTAEISDEETLSFQYAPDGKPARWTHFGSPCRANRFRAPFVSNREPDGCWFGLQPRLEWHCADPQRAAFFCQHLDDYCRAYRFREVFNLTDNNCSKFVSYLLWQTGLANHVATHSMRWTLLGFRDQNYWNALYPRQPRLESPSSALLPGDSTMLPLLRVQ